MSNTEGIQTTVHTPAEAGTGADELLREDLSVEEAFAELERLVHRMEEEGISLEESFACYERGIRLVRFCNDRIDRVEKKVQMLRGEGEARLPDQL